MSDLLHKYDIPAPRYTSYPTVPFWETDQFKEARWREAIIQTFWQNNREISLYIHLPFCESLCTYCGCHTYITKNHQVEEPYIAYLLKEWRLYLQLLPAKPKLMELHLGGGTPTFFNSDNLGKLIETLKEGCEIGEETQFSFEAHPGNTTREHLIRLRALGFDRLSLGIQDFDKTVQRTINRIQSYEQVLQTTQLARSLGYRSINYDLVYGLPGQTLDTLVATCEHVKELAPDRIAFYSYAHVPKLKPAQKSFEHLLPAASDKQAYYLAGKKLLTKAGYREVGMDHFAKAEDELLQASKNDRLHRNFMGYTTQHHQLLIGLGISAIGDSWGAFVQNHKKLSDYKAQLDNGYFPIAKGHLHTQEDLFFRKTILAVMCKGSAQWSPEDLDRFGLGINWELIDQLETDGLITVNELGLNVTLKGRQFLRIVGMALDARLSQSGSRTFAFSKAI